MTSVTVHITAPTPVELGVLRVAHRLTAFVEQRVARRAERRLIALDLLRQQQTSRHNPHAVDHALAQLGLPER